MEPKRNKQYTNEFKIQALELAKSLGSYSAAARQLGVSDSLIHDWKKRFGWNKLTTDKAVAQAVAETEEVKRLRKEIDELKKVNYILKKAAAFFSQDHLK